MGTNFYLKSKIPREVYDCFHIAKTSYGWKPHFEGMPPAASWDPDEPEPLEIRSVEDIRKAYESGKFEIVDEEGDTYDWEQFAKRVLQHQPEGKSHNHSNLYQGCPTWDDSDGYEFVQYEFS